MIMLKKLCGLIILMKLLAPAMADEGTGPRKIIDLGCDNRVGICYVTVDGSPFGASNGCGSSNEFRFDNGDTVLGAKSFSALYAAYLVQKRISIVINGCTSQGYNALAYFHIFD